MKDAAKPSLPPPPPRPLEPMYAPRKAAAFTAAFIIVISFGIVFLALLALLN